MGSPAIMYAVVALASGLVGLLVGFFWARSNVNAKVEHAIEKEHASLDAREYAMRQQLEDAYAEVAKLRPLAEELGRVQERLKREQSKYERMKTEFVATINPGASEPSKNEEGTGSQPEKPTESADETIQKLLQSLESLNAPAGQHPMPIEHAQSIEPAVAESPQPLPDPQPVQTTDSRTPSTTPRVSQPAETRQRQTAGSSPAQLQRPAASEPAKTAPVQTVKPTTSQPPKPGQPLDEWQEFARQLEALTGQKIKQ